MVEGLLIVPDWEKKPFREISNLIQDLPILGGRFSVSSSFFNRAPVDASMQELIDRYGESAIKRARKAGEKLGANVALLYCTRGFDKLEVTVNYFFLRE